MVGKRPYPDAVQDAFATVSLVAHVLAYLDVTDIVCVQLVSKAFQQAAAQPATWAHSVWQPTVKHRPQLTRILQHSLPHLHTLVLTHKIWTRDDFDVQALIGVQSLRLSHDAIYYDPDEDNVGFHPYELLDALLVSIRQNHIRLTHLALSPGELLIVDSVLDSLVSIPTLKQVNLDVGWQIDGKQIDKYVPLVAAKGCEIHMSPSRSVPDYFSGLKTELLNLSALKQAHHCTTLCLSEVDVEAYQLYLDWLDETPTEDVPAATSSKLRVLEFSITDQEMDAMMPSFDKAKICDCNYNDWLHVFLSHHPNLQSVRIASRFPDWEMTDALCNQLRRMSHLKRLHIPSCDMSQQQRKLLQPLLAGT